MTHWAMIIDLRKCIGCETCKHVCSEMNTAPVGAGWRRVIDPGNTGSGSGRVFLPISCMHCKHPPCNDVCPSGATIKDTNGIVHIKLDKCLGCGACVVACPYQARSICTQDKIPSSTQEKDRIGICSKCHFCRPVIESGLAKGLKPGIDPEATPYCVRYCLGEALHFGDLDDPDSEVSKLIRNNKTTKLQKDLGTQPSVFYILDFS